MGSESVSDVIRAVFNPFQMKNRLGLADAGKSGFWGSITSTLDWCEENYVVNQYVSELWNVLSNFTFLLLGLLGLWTCYKYSSEKRFWFCYMLSMSVGIGSMLFHGTLKYEMQLADELPMVYTACMFCFCLLTTFVERLYIKRIFATILIAYSVFVSVAYLLLKEPFFNHTTTALVVVVDVVLPVLHIIRISKSKGGKKHVRPLFYIYLSGVASFVFGFILWNIEHWTCGNLRIWRTEVGYPWRILSELHAWWHFLSGVGVYNIVVLNQYLRELALRRGDIVYLKYVGLLPVIHKKDLRTSPRRSPVRAKSDKRE